MNLPVSLKLLYWRWKLRNEVMPAGFDPRWYLGRYSDVAVSEIPPELHYLRFGRYERRDPNPNFSASGYVYTVPEAGELADPLVHYEQTSEATRAMPMPVLAGLQPPAPDKLTLMVCAHQAEPELYGAERSLLDVLAGLNTLGVNLVVTLPSALNPGYIAQVRELAWKVAIMPYGWWHGARPPVEQTVHNFECLLSDYDVDAVYANTLVLCEPILAARRTGLPSVVHVRELLAYDEALCRSLGAPVGQVSEWLKQHVDHIVANSRYTAQSLGFDNAHIVPNGVDLAEYLPATEASRVDQSLSVGMISSNLPKKGLEDFVALARMLESASPDVRCVLVGPENEHILALKQEQKVGRVPDNLVFRGYADTPQTALASLNVVVNLSHFQESFGRTVLEAMAMERPVVAYKWGALPELVSHGVTGFLVPLGDVSAVASYIVQLVNDMSLRKRLGRAGRERAERCYSVQAMKEALSEVIGLLSDSKSRIKPEGTSGSVF